MRPKIAILLVASVSTLVATEIAGYLFLRFQRAQHGHVFAFTSQEVIDAFSNNLTGYLQADKPTAPHPTLGWIRKPDSVRHLPEFGDTTTDGEGARVIPGASGPLLMDTYGDSFTECSEVSDQDTWQAHLAKATSTRVRNFGVSAYGPDQACRYLDINLDKGVVAPIVLLGVIHENLNRLMNAFRPFYTYPSIDHPLGFKPMLLANAGEYQWVTYLPPDCHDLSAVAAAIDQARQVDACAALRSETASFPFGLRAAGFLWRHGVHPTRVCPGSTEEAARRAAFLLAGLTKRVLGHGGIPAVLFIPMTEADFALERVPILHETLRFMPDDLRAKLVVIDVVERFRAKGLSVSDIPEKYRPYLRVTHPARQGNLLIADLLLDGLCASSAIQADAKLHGLVSRSAGR